MSYTVVILQSGSDPRAQVIEQQLKAATEGTWLDPDIVGCCPTLPNDPDQLERPVVVVYLTPTDGNRADMAAAAEEALDDRFTVLPVVSLGVDGAERLPARLRRLQTIPWRENGTDVVAAILRCLGLSEDDRRVFLSYSREPLSIAVTDSLWRRLSELGFDVFLDRYRSTPGEDFRWRLDRELADKAFVVIVESNSAHTSRWVRHEVTYALAHHIGLLAVTLPNTLPRHRLRAISPAYRYQMRSDDLQPDGTLTADALDTLIKLVSTEHERMLVRRRAQLLLSAEDVLFQAGWSYSEVADWSLLAERNDGGAVEVLRITPRLPRPLDMYRLDTLRATLVKGAVVPAATPARLVHAASDTDPELSGLMSWIALGRHLELTELAHLPAAVSAAVG